MTIENLECFLVLANELNFTRAAEQCHISQTAVSRRIGSIEEELGVRLFERDHHNVTLTHAGSALCELLPPILKNYHLTVSHVQDIERGVVNSIRIGVGLYEHLLLQPLIPELVKRFPVARLSYVQYGYKALLEEFVQDHLDLILTSDQYLPGIDRTGIASLLIYDKPWVLALNRHNPLCALKEIPTGELTQRNLITMYEGSLPSISERYKSILPSLASVDYANNLDTKLALINADRGIAFIPGFVSTDGYPDVTIRALTPPYRPRRFYILYKQDNPNASIGHLAADIASRYRSSVWLEDQA